MRIAAKRDRNESDIVAALELVGCSVLRVSSTAAPDLMVGVAGNNVLMEVKWPGEGLTPAQAALHARWAGAPIHIVTSPAEALSAVGYCDEAIERILSGNVLVADVERAVRGTRAATPRSRPPRAPSRAR